MERGLDISELTPLLRWRVCDLVPAISVWIIHTSPKPRHGSVEGSRQSAIRAARPMVGDALTRNETTERSALRLADTSTSSRLICPINSPLDGWPDAGALHEQGAGYHNPNRYHRIGRCCHVLAEPQHPGGSAGSDAAHGADIQIPSALSGNKGRSQRCHSSTRFQLPNRL
jgi:hypothetical protein